jgi:hypothetical protein
MTNEIKAKVYDLDAICKAEGDTQEPFLFRCGGKKFTIPRPIDWPDSVYAVPVTKDIVTAARDLLGDKYEDFLKAGGTANKLMTVLRAIEAEQGADAGESEASTDS